MEQILRLGPYRRARSRGSGEAAAAGPFLTLTEKSSKDVPPSHLDRRCPTRAPLRVVVRALAILVLVGCAADEDGRVLRVCSDPNNLPFSNAAEEGFENRLAELLARELKAKLEYTWRPQWRGFIRTTLGAGACDLVMGVPSSFELALPTRPYYRSSYVFLSRADRGLEVRSFDDPGLRSLSIGVHVIGDDYTNTPPAHALAARGLIENVVGYSVYGEVVRENPPARLVEAVAEGEVDLAIVWGPFAGFFAERQPVELVMRPVSPRVDLPFLPMVYDIAMGVRREDSVFRSELDDVLVRIQPEIDAILEAYGVPSAESGARSAGGAGVATGAAATATGAGRGGE